MANEFVARKGLIALADSTVSGSLNVTGTLTGDGSGLTGIVAVQAPGGSDGQIQYNNGGVTAGASLYWDDVNNKLGIGISTPNDLLNIHSSDVNANIGIKITRGAQSHGLRIGVNNSHAFIWTTENQNIAFGTNNSQRVTITNGGRVGIGTSSPSTAFQVVGGTSDGWAIFQRGTKQLYVNPNYSGQDVFAQLAPKNGDNMDLSLAATDIRTDDIYIKYDTGNVGIGTTSPATKLHVQGTGLFVADSTTGRVLRLRDRAANGANIIQFEDAAGSNIWEVTGRSNEFYIYKNSGNGSAYKYRINSNGDHNWDSGKMYLTYSTGNVGIGTTSPSYKLQVNHGTTSEYVSSFQNTADNLQLKVGTTTGALLNIQGATINTNAAYNIALQAEGGNVGIGTSSPIQKLDVIGNIQTTGRIDFVNANAHVQRNGNELQLGAYSGWRFYDMQGSSTRMFLSQTGNLGIGTTSPAGKLHVYGGRSYFAPAGDSNSGNNSDVFVAYNPFDTAFTADALAAYNNHTSWDIGSRSTYTISSRTKNGSIYTFAGENNSSAVAINRYVQFDSSNDSPLLNWTFYQYDGSGTAASDLKTPNKVWTVQSYQNSGSDTLLILNGDGTLQLPQYGAGFLKTDASGNVTVDTSTFLTAEADTLATVTGRGNYTGTSLTFGSPSPFTFVANANTGTFNRTVVYANQNNTSGDQYNGIMIERGRITDSNVAEVRHFTIGARGGQVQWKVDGDGNTTQTGGASISGDLTVGGTITAQEFRAEFITNTIILESGSTQFGDSADDIHTFTGTLDLNGNMDITDGNTISVGGLNGIEFGNGAIGNEVRDISIFTDINGEIALQRGGRNVIFIDSNLNLNPASNTIIANGNVGIGTSSPAYKLEVDGSFGITQSSTVAHLSGNSSGNLTINNTTGQINFLANGSTVNSMWITASGITLNENVDVNYDLNVDGNLSIGGGESADDARIYIKASDNSNRFTIETDLDGTTNNDLLGFRAASTDNILVLKGDGKVGIGTNAPVYRIHAKTADATWGYRFENNTGVEDVHTFLSHGGGYGIAVDSTSNSSSTYLLKLSGGTGGTGLGTVEHFRVTSDGKVGIGELAPVSPLHIKSNSQQIAINRPDGSGALWKFYSWGDGLNIYPDIAKDIFIGRDGATTNLQLHNGILKVLGTGISHFAGNLGIGTTTTDARLTVSSGTSNNVANFKSTDSLAYIAISDNASSSALGNQVGVVGDDMYFATGDVERMRIHADGDVQFNDYGVGNKIGTGNPAYALAVDASGNLMETAVQSVPTGGSGTDNYLAKWVNTSELGNSTIFDDGTNVGIGTATPTAKLEVFGNGGTVLDIQGSNGQLFSVTDSLVGSLMSVNDISGLPILEVFDTDKVVMGEFGSNALVVTGSNVGIGTDAPTDKLEILDGRLKITNTGSGRSGTIGLDDSYNLYVKNPGAGNLYLGTGTTTFVSGNLNVAGGALYVKASNDNVGIGTTDPSAALQIYSGLKLYSNGVFTWGASSNYGTLTWDGAKTIVKAQASKELHLGANNSDSNIVINTIGNVGIGTTSPFYKLDVSGNARVTSTLDVTGNIATAGNISASGYIGSNTSQTRDKIRVWSSGEYAIGMKSGFTYGHLNDYAMTFQMNNDVNRGFWWGDSVHSDAQGAMSLTTDGRLTVANSLSIGQGESITSAASDSLFVEGGTRLYSVSATPTLLTLHNYQSDITPGSGNFIDFKMTDGNVTATPQVRIGMVIGTEGGSDDGIATEGDGNFIIQTTNATGDSGTETPVERVRVTHTGTVVIGNSSSGYNTNQGYPLHVISQTQSQSYLAVARSGQNSGVEGAIFGLDQSNAYLQIRDNIPLILGTNNQSSIWIKPGGNVGIANSNPAYKLDVAGAAEFQDYIRITDTGGAQRILLGNQDSAGANNPSVITAANGTTYIGGGSSWVGDGGTLDYTATFTDDGRVGIGTTSPTSTLHVVGTTAMTDTLTISKGASDAVQQGSSVYLNGGTGSSYTQLQQGVGKFIIYGFDGAAWQNRFTLINANGNVGIGTSSPAAKLHVNSGFIRVDASSNAQGVEIYGRSSDNIGELNFRTSAGAFLGRVDGRSDGLGIWSSSGLPINFKPGNTGIKVTFQNNGNVGIGTTSPSQQLHITGNIQIDGGSIKGNTDFLFLTTGNAAQLARFGGIQVSTSYGGTPPYNGILFHTDNQLQRTAADELTYSTTSGTGAIVPGGNPGYFLGRDSRRWEIVFCNILDSAGLHEKNLENPEGEKSIGDYATGTVLVWKGGKNVPCTVEADHMRMGIAVEGMASPLVQGAEPVLCTGVINEGDYIISSDKEGHAKGISRQEMLERNLFDVVLGKALEQGEGESYLLKVWITI